MLLSMRNFTALYTHQKQKKAKTWQDGFARYDAESNTIVLLDSASQRIASYRLRAKEDIELAREYDVGRFLVTLEEEESGNKDDNANNLVGDDGSSRDSSNIATLSTLRRSLLKRSKRVPSLIKPVKLKSDATKNANASTSSLTIQPTGPTDTAQQQNTKSSLAPIQSTSSVATPSNAVEYTVLYTTQKVKKVKAWAEGTLTFYPDEFRISLKSEDGTTMTSTHVPRSKTIEVGGEIDVGMYLIQIESLKESDDKSSTSTAAATSTLTKGSKLSGVLKRRYEAVQEGGTLRSPLAGTQRSTQSRIGLHKKTSAASPSSSFVEDGTASAAAVSTTTEKETSVIPSLSRAQSSSLSSNGSVTSTGSKLRVSKSMSTALPPKRAQFVPPASQVPKYLHFPRRGELLQHVSVEKGYGIGPSRQLTAPVKFAQWKHYQETLTTLLHENLMVELSALAIRYFFMAREKHEGSRNRADAASGSFRKRSKFGDTGSFVHACRSVGVTYFEDCTLRQPFLDGKAFRAQASKGSVQFEKGDSVTIELSRREKAAGFSKDDTWAISTTADFARETTFLARSAYFGPTKNNTLELTIIGPEDAAAAMRIFNDAMDSRRGAQSVKVEPTVVAIRCLDSASDWTMLETVEELLSPESLPLLQNLLDSTPTLGPALSPDISSNISTESVMIKVNEILQYKRQELHLNPEQFSVLEQVVMSAVSIYIPVPDASPVTIVHGPFGTGKSFLVAAVTITLDAIASEIPEVFGAINNDGIADLSDIAGNHETQDPALSKRPPRLRVLVSSMTNFAVDNMLEALLKQGYDEFLRVGNLKRISKRILPYVCRSSTSSADDIKELEAMLEAAENEDEQESIATALQRVRQQQTTLDLLESAFVVGTTCLSAATAAIRSSSFPVVILDEACQIVEPMALIALAAAGCHRIVLVGDPLQLPPTLTTRGTKACEGKGLDRALFDRLVQMGYRAHFLATQFRCHPHIASLCNQLFYSGRLQHGISPDDRPPLVPGAPPLAFLDVAGSERQHGRSQSFYNKSEIDMVVLLVRHMLLAGVKPDSIGVIALYKTQSDMLHEQLAGALGQRMSVQVSTVDAYQGSERDVIIISCVRSEKVGFTSNPNRVNVALSRARNHCLILGSRKLLETNSMWRKIIDYCRTSGGPGSVCPAQAFANRLSQAIVTDRGREEESVDAWTNAMENIDSNDIDVCEIASEDLHYDPASAEPSSLNEAGERQPIDNGRASETEAEAEDECMEIGEFGDDSVIGGTLSQWTPSALDSMLVGNYSDSDRESEVDIVDCLDVDLDDM